MYDGRHWTIGIRGAVGGGRNFWMPGLRRYEEREAMNKSPLSDKFMAVITPCQSKLFGYLYSLLCNMDDTEDVLQQAVLAMWRRFDEYDRSRSFLNWAMKFAELTALNHIRPERRDRVVFNEELVLMLAGAYGPEQDADFLDAYHDALLHCMDRLSPADRELIRLCYFEKCNIKRAADKLGRTPQSVCNSLRRIRGLLFDCIQASFPAEDDA